MLSTFMGSDNFLNIRAHRDAHTTPLCHARSLDVFHELLTRYCPY